MPKKRMTADQMVKRIKARQAICSATPCPYCGAATGELCVGVRLHDRQSPHRQRTQEYHRQQRLARFTQADILRAL